MKKAFRILAVLLASLTLLSCSAFALPSANRSGSTLTPQSAYEEAELLAEYIRILHIDSGANDNPLLRGYQKLTGTDADLSANALRRALIRLFEEDLDALELLEDAMLDCYDPYSNLFDAEEYEAAYPSDEDYTGIGFTYHECGVFLAVSDVYTDSPAGRAGICPGDLIVKLDGHDLRFLDSLDRLDLMDRYRQRSFTLTVLRGHELLDFTLSPGAVSVPYIEHCILDDGVGYLAINRFGGDSFTEDLNAATQDFRASGVRNVIIDLRDNPGGTLSTLLEALNAFVPEGGLLLFRELERGAVTPHYSTGVGLETDSICILTSSGSASSSEIFTGVLSDLGLAVVIGSETYGKGRGQGGIYFGDSILMLSMITIELPVRGCYDGHGLVPDIEVDDTKALIDADSLAPLDTASVISPSSDASDILALEQRLSALGFLQEDADGVWDDETESALAQFYRGMGLTVQKKASTRLLYTLAQLTQSLEDAYVTTDASLETALEWLAEQDAA